MTVDGYVHGYSSREEERLADQAETLTGLLHHDTRYRSGERVLEAGCGVGAQTVILAGSSPGTGFVSVDISADSLSQAKKRVDEAGLANVVLSRMDIYDLSFPESSFDHVFVCFVLEHLSRPVAALTELRRVLVSGGTVTVIEGDHGSAHFFPDSDHARRGVSSLIKLQEAAGGDALIGRRLYPLLKEGGFSDVTVSPRLVYVDDSRPALVEGFTRNTFTAMVAGVKEKAVSKGLMTEPDFRQGITDLLRTAEGGGTFCYTFFKAVGAKGT